jgi:glycerophosphoryl diester phosphodiesterase
MILTARDDGLQAARDAGVRWAGLDRRADPAVFDAWRDAGFRVVAYTVNDRAERDRLLALGVCGFFSDDPIAVMA